ncbi:MAG: outer membrane beta-barrel protein [Gammaproteobacteria bacterium]|nr:outer membrane beta-barrel protein [Gammaproteobacteria bacterium]
MHGLHAWRLLPATPLVLALLWAMAVHGQPAAASDQSSGSTTTSPRDGEHANRHAPYLSLGVARIRSQDTRFVDGKDAGHAALYGNAELFDAGSIDDGLQFRLAAGVHLPYRLRAQLELGFTRALDWQGSTNYRHSGEHQPSEASLDTRQLLLAGFHDFPGWELVPGRRARPFLGAGLGMTDYRLRGYVQRFPEPDNPQGSLRRGPGGEIPFTALPEGSGRNLTWMWTAGIAIAISSSTHLDLSYRYTDAGEIRTDVGDIAIVRYRADGTRREIPVQINATTADDRTHAMAVTLRFDF